MLTCSGDSLTRLHQTTLGRRIGAELFTHVFNQYPLPMNVPCGAGEPTRLVMSLTPHKVGDSHLRIGYKGLVR
jgi:hypothetical protein